MSRTLNSLKGVFTINHSFGKPRSSVYRLGIENFWITSNPIAFEVFLSLQSGIFSMKDWGRTEDIRPSRSPVSRNYANICIDTHYQFHERERVWKILYTWSVIECLKMISSFTIKGNSKISYSNILDFTDLSEILHIPPQFPAMCREVLDPRLSQIKINIWTTLRRAYNSDTFLVKRYKVEISTSHDALSPFLSAWYLTFTIVSSCM